MTELRYRWRGAALGMVMGAVVSATCSGLRADDGAGTAVAPLGEAPPAVHMETGTVVVAEAAAVAASPGVPALTIAMPPAPGDELSQLPVDTVDAVPVSTGAVPVVDMPVVDPTGTVVGAVSDDAPAYSDRVSLSFAEGASIDEVLTAFSLQTGKGIVLGPEVTGQVMLRLRNAPWEEALRVILEPYGYGYKAIGDTIVVSKLEQRAITESLESLQSRVFTLKYLDAFGVKDMIEAQLSKRGSLTTLTIRGQRGWEYASAEKGAVSGSGADSGKRVRMQEDESQREVERQRSRTIVVTDVASVLERIEGLLSAVDIMPVQVLIEARFVEVDHGVLQDLGVQFGTGRGGVTSSGPTPVNVTTDGNLVGVGVQQSGGAVAPSAFAPNSLELKNKQPFNAGLTLLFQKLDPTQFEVMLHMLEEDNYLNVLSAPRILTLNNQEATIMVGTKYPIIRTDVSGDTGTASTSIDYWQDIGIQLNVVPQICEREHIRMVIHPAVTAQIGTVSGRTVTGTGGTVIPSTDYPVLSTRETETQIILRSGEMLAIGGLLKDEERKTEFKVPFLGDIPLLGWLFRRETTSMKKLDLVIFLTATIVPPEEAVTLGESPRMQQLRDLRADSQAATVDAVAQAADIDQRTVVDTVKAVGTEEKVLEGDDRIAISEQDRRDAAWREDERQKEELIRRLQEQRKAFVETLRGIAEKAPPGASPPPPPAM